LLVVGAVAGLATEERAGDSEFSGKLDEEILQLALQHPYHDLHGRGSVE
jgi:hypothetical protein